MSILNSTIHTFQPTLTTHPNMDKNKGTREQVLKQGQEQTAKHGTRTN